jgi:hypothetical protein
MSGEIDTIMLLHIKSFSFFQLLLEFTPDRLQQPKAILLTDLDDLK